jgi:hypothetical protein
MHGVDFYLRCTNMKFFSAPNLNFLLLYSFFCFIIWNFVKNIWLGNFTFAYNIFSEFWPIKSKKDAFYNQFLGQNVKTDLAYTEYKQNEMPCCCNTRQ